MNSQSFSLPTKQQIVQAFIHIHNPNSSPEIRKQADQFLMNAETQYTFIDLMKLLLDIYEQQYAIEIRLQALINLSNIIKRNWNNRRLLKNNKQFPQIKKNIQNRMISYLSDATLSENTNQYRPMTPSLFQIVRFLVKNEYPHSYPEFTQYTQIFLGKMQLSEEFIKNFKQIRQIYLQLAERKGNVSRKSFEDSLRNNRYSIGVLSQQLLQQISNQVSKPLIKLSKYCDQILIAILRISPFQLLDQQYFCNLRPQSLNIGIHLIQKLQFLLTVHSNNVNSAIKQLLEKSKILKINLDIKALIYQIGCLQTANPCYLAPILSEYIQTLFYVISKPQLFVKKAVLKYSLIGMRKLIRQFTYYADDGLFLKSISSNTKSQNYLQLREVCHKAYIQFLTPQTVQGMFNFLLTNVMNIQTNQSDNYSLNFQDSSSYEKSAQKQLNVQICGTFLIETLIERFTQHMIKLIYSLVQSCMANNWQSINVQTQLNFLSAISVLPKSFRRNQLQFLGNFPIIEILQYVHSNIALRSKFPQLIVGWLEIFTNQQINSLVNVLIEFIGNQSVSQGNQANYLLLCSCYSLNKVVMYRGTNIDYAYILHQVFPIALGLFTKTDAPEVLWPLISLISTLISKCQFDTNMIISSMQNNVLNALVTNQSFMLIDSLADMLKTFLCVIPRNQPAEAVFMIVYHFLNQNLKKSEQTLIDKLVTLWYFAIRQFSAINHCDQQYLDLFESHYKRCLHRKSPTLIYILQEYMLLGLIDNKIQNFIQIVLQFYQQAAQLQQSGHHQQAKNLKISALSFEITLITKYNLQKVNNQQLLWVILKDFCSTQSKQSNNTPSKQTSNTLHNSILSIINRYIIINKAFLCQFLDKIGLTRSAFFHNYFVNIQYLTSRTAIKLNTIAMIHLMSVICTDQSLKNNYLLNLLCQIIPEIQDNNQQHNSNQKQVENSPSLRFSASVLSQLKQQIRREDNITNVSLKQLFLHQLRNLNIDFTMICSALGNDMANRLRNICGI